MDENSSLVGDTRTQLHVAIDQPCGRLGVVGLDSEFVWVVRPTPSHATATASSATNTSPELTETTCEGSGYGGLFMRWPEFLMYR